jgi:hypothetical protein
VTVCVVELLYSARFVGLCRRCCHGRHAKRPSRLVSMIFNCCCLPHLLVLDRLARSP